MGNGCEGNCGRYELATSSFLTLAEEEEERKKWLALEKSLKRDELTIGMSSIIAKRMLEVGKRSDIHA